MTKLNQTWTTISTSLYNDQQSQPEQPEQDINDTDIEDAQFEEVK
jgi:hypothetical protein